MKGKTEKYVLASHHKKMLVVLQALKGTATTREIAQVVGLSVAGVSVGMKTLYKHGYVDFVGGSKGDTRWKISKKGLRSVG